MMLIFRLRVDRSLVIAVAQDDGTLALDVLVLPLSRYSCFGKPAMTCVSAPLSNKSYPQSTMVFFWKFLASGVSFGEVMGRAAAIF